MKRGRVFYCPNCGKRVLPADRWLPFCRERCRLIDLGKWLDEEHRVSGDPAQQEKREEQDDREG